MRSSVFICMIGADARDGAAAVGNRSAENIGSARRSTAFFIGFFLLRLDDVTARGQGAARAREVFLEVISRNVTGVNRRPISSEVRSTLSESVPQ